jgi:hypothetical protein
MSKIGKQMALCILIMFGLSQCATTEDGRLTQAQGTGMGAVGGALLGAGLGALTGNSEAVKKGALIGGAIGAAGGFSYGTHVANKKAQYKSTEEWLDACITNAEKKRTAAVAYNSRLNNEYARLQSEVKKAQMAGDKRKLSSLKRQIASERKAAEKEAVAFNKEAELQRGAIKEAGGKGGSRLRSLRTSTSGIESQVNSINSNVQRVAALESQTDV